MLRLTLPVILCLSLLYGLDGCSGASGKMKLDTSAGKSSIDRFVPGDGLRIVVYPDSSSFLNGIYPISSEGEILLPIVGRISVVNQTPAQLVSYIQKTYQQYLRYPDVQAIPLVRVSMLGGFARPGLYYIEPDRSIWDCIYLAGGTPRESGIRKLRWERDSRIIDENLIALVEKGTSLRDIGFQSGDQIWTPDDRPRGTFDMLQLLLPLLTAGASLVVSLITLSRI